MLSTHIIINKFLLSKYEELKKKSTNNENIYPNLFFAHPTAVSYAIMPRLFPFITHFVGRKQDGKLFAKIILIYI